ncbi:TPA: GNAT family N-acetyltransferase, partial [Staphylococcus aureus]|nr:GNAT family N-acetyltransferase [Staphylococcus aureus]
MIRLGKMSDLDQILNLVEEAKELMKKHDNEQWDDQYP